MVARFLRMKSDFSKVDALCDLMPDYGGFVKDVMEALEFDDGDE